MSDHLRVLFVHSEWPAPDGRGDGIGRTMATTARDLARLGVEVHALIVNAEIDQRSDEVVDDVQIHRRPMRWTSVLRLGMKLRCYEPVVRLLAAGTVRIETKWLGPFDVVESPNWGAMGLLLPRRQRCVVLLVTPLAISGAIGGDRLGRRRRVAAAFERIATNRADLAIADSGRHRDELIERGLMSPRGPTEVVHLAVDLHDHAVAAQSARTTVLQVGTLGPRKGQDITIEALGALRRAGHDPRLVIVGGGSGAERERLEAIASEHGVPISFLSGLSESGLCDAYLAARVLVQPSRYDSFGLPVVEAMLHGTPVLVSDNVGAAELLPPFGDGALVASEDPEVWAKAIEPYLVSDERVASDGELALAIARAAVDGTSLARRRIELYRSLADRRPASRAGAS